MILNERQYAISQRKLRDAEDNIKRLRAGEGDVAADDRRVAMASLEAFALQLRGELAEYGALRSGATPVVPVAGLEALPLALIRARIAKRLKPGSATLTALA